MRLKFFAFFAVLFCLFVFNSWAEPQLSLSVGTVYDLGKLKEGRVYEKGFLITNNGDSELSFRAIKSNCGCTRIVSPLKEVKLAPGKTQEIKFTFNTEGMEGIVNKFLYISSNDPNSTYFKLSLVAEVKRSHLETLRRFMSFGLLTIISAGLIDGINPCAFTVLVFFISFLTFAGYKKKELFILGVTFIIAVFLTYFFLGLGLFRAMRSLEIFSFFSKIVYFGISIFSIVLGIFSLYDWYIYRKNKNVEDIKLKLPEKIKNTIHKIIQDSSRDKKKALIRLVLAVFSSGILISLLESICTGQTYIPTIVYMLKVNELRPYALINLFIYNLMFILPLIIIFIAGLFGVTSDKFSKISREHLGTVKLLTAILFFLLGILIILARNI